MGGRLATVHVTKRLGELLRERLGFGFVLVRSFRQPSPGLGLGHGIGRRFPSWTRHLCLLLEIVLCRVARHRNLLSYSCNDCGHSFFLAQHIFKCIGVPLSCNNWGWFLFLKLIVLATYSDCTG
ncbi:UNVERIFIED_CONTAM: hypothetical protein Sradi_4005000 [Sesamum radiatum]|uniref:Uncharacterized protein n=1 Tax=Sesamum radiatum TaxID=300843 RepID=A0AAW2PMH9_SESRA